jgi:sarcosine oxidase subunit gamma
MGADTVQPEDFNRRSFVYQKLHSLGARFGEVNAAAVALAYGDASPESEAKQARSLALVDLSPLPRCGFKGRGTGEWLTEQGIQAPPESNRAAAQNDGCLAVRLAPSEVLILGNWAEPNDATGRLEAAWRADEIPPRIPRGFPMPRQESHAWFAVSGEHAATMFAKLCAVDLRPVAFDNGAVAQTSVARLNVVIIRHDLGETPNYFVLPDSASAVYFWDCLADAMDEFAGTPVGLDALRRLAGTV